MATAEQSKSVTEEADGDELFDHDIDEFLRHHDDFDDLAAVKVLGHFFDGLGKAADFVLTRVDGHADSAGIFKSGGDRRQWRGEIDDWPAIRTEQPAAKPPIARYASIDPQRCRKGDS